MDHFSSSLTIAKLFDVSFFGIIVSPPGLAELCDGSFYHSFVGVTRMSTKHGTGKEVPSRSG